MSFQSRGACVLALAAVVLAPVQAFSGETSRDGKRFWQVERQGDVCMATLRVDGGFLFMLTAANGKVSFAAAPPKPMAPGTTARIATESLSFDFPPSYGKNNDYVFFAGGLNDQALSALRTARRVGVFVDEKLVMGAAVEGTDLDGALDALVACARGERGWWDEGPGDTPAAAPAPVAVEPRLNKEKAWAMNTGGPGACVAQADVGRGLALQVLGSKGSIALAFGSSDRRLPKGRRGLVEAGSVSFGFTPDYAEAGHYVITQNLLDSQAVAALRGAPDLRVTIDGKEVLNVNLATTGYPAILDEVAACSRGEKGWWTAD